MIHSRNRLVYYITCKSLSMVNGCLGENFIFILLSFNVDMTKCSYSVARNKIMSNYLKDNIHNISCGNAIRELCSIRDGCQSLSGFTKSDICELIDDISTSVINKSN